MDQVIAYSRSAHPEEYYHKLEKHTTIYISKTLRKVILRGNRFEKNIGTYGGAVVIDSPKLSGSNLINGINDGVVILKGNTFIGNMAYMSGNAVYINLVSQWVHSGCGGVYDEGNTYQQNFGGKRSQGGAIFIQCSSVSPTDASFDFQSRPKSENVTLTDPLTTSITYPVK